MVGLWIVDFFLFFFWWFNARGPAKAWVGFKGEVFGAGAKNENINGESEESCVACTGR